MGDRRRDPRGRADQARRAPGADARTARARCVGDPVQRIGLSATQRPLEEVGRFLVGTGRDCTVVDTGLRKPLDIQIQVPVDDMTEPDQGVDLNELNNDGTATRRSIWPAIYPELLRARPGAPLDDHLRERPPRAPSGWRVRLNELAGEDGEPADIARAHHGSLAREERLVVEEMLKSRRAAVPGGDRRRSSSASTWAPSTSCCRSSRRSRSPPGLQRIGRAGHGVGEVSKGRIFPKFRADLLECAVVAKRMRSAEIETTVVPRNPLDVLAQQIVAMVATGDDWRVPELHDRVRRAYPYTDLSRELLDQVLDMLDGRYPSEEFAELRPRIVWDRVEDIDPRAQGRAASSP